MIVECYDPMMEPLSGCVNMKIVEVEDEVRILVCISGKMNFILIST